MTRASTIALSPMIREHGIKVTIPYKPREIFKPYHSRKQRFALTVCHRRGGKTVCEINEGIKKILTCTRSFPTPQALFISPTFGQSKRNAWQYLKYYTSGIPGMKHAEGELTATFPNGGKYIFGGSDNYDSLRGMYLDHASMDEFGSMDPQVWGQVIRPALSDYGGSATFIGSANGMNHFYDLMQAHKNDPDWMISDFKASETNLLSKEELELARNTMTPEQYRQEYENDFTAAVVGTFYGAEISAADSEHRICSVPHDRAADVFAGWDLGIGGATSIWLYQRIGFDWHFIGYYEGYRPDSGLEDACDWLKTLPFKVVEHFLPHDAEAREMMTPNTTRKEFLEARGFNCTVLPRGRVEDGINTVRVNFNRFWFDKQKCEQGITSLRMYRTLYDEKKKVFSKAPVHDWASHAADALRYSVMAMPDVNLRSDWKRPVLRNLKVVA